MALGYFDTELDAHRAWVAAKEEAMAILLDSVHLEPRVVEGMHRKLKQFQARFAACPIPHEYQLLKPADMRGRG